MKLPTKAELTAKGQKTHPKTAMYSILHYPHELHMTQTPVAVFIEELKQSVDQVFRQLVAGGYFYRPFEFVFKAIHYDNNSYANKALSKVCCKTYKLRSCLARHSVCVVTRGQLRAFN